MILWIQILLCTVFQHPTLPRSGPKVCAGGGGGWWWWLVGFERNFSDQLRIRRIKCNFRFLNSLSRILNWTYRLIIVNVGAKIRRNMGSLFQKNILAARCLHKMFFFNEILIYFYIQSFEI